MEKIEIRDSIDIVMPKIWSIFELLKRSGKVNSIIEQAEVTLLLLSLYKDGLITNDFLNNRNIIKEPIVPYGKNVYDENTYESYRKTIWDMTSYLSGIDDYLFKQISYTLFDIDKIDLKANFSQIFDSVLYQASKTQGKFGVEFLQTAELSQLICELANGNDDMKVFNPFAGVASNAIFLKHYSSYLGQEISASTHALAELRLLAYGKTSNSVVECRNSIMEWPDESQKFDLIVSTPPFGMKLNALNIPIPLGSIQNQFIQIRTIEEFVLLKGINTLTAKGKMIVVVPRGFLSSGIRSSLETRLTMVENDFLDMVISLPAGIFNSTNTSTSILVVNKNKKKRGVVKFINAENCYIQQNNSKLLDTQTILAKISNEHDSDILKSISHTDIRKNGYNLNPNLYFKKEIVVPVGFEIKELKDLLTVIKRNTNHNETIGRYISIGNLANDVSDYVRTFSNLGISLLRKKVIKLNKSALLISMVSLKQKPTYFVSQSADNPIFINSNIEAFEINEKKVLIPYLIHELYADYFQEQLDSLSSGSAIASISTENFLSCKIRIPSMEKQKAIVDDSRSQLIREKEKELKELREKFEQQTYEEFASLKHALGKPIPGINTALEYIYDYIKNNQGEKISLSDVISQRRQSTLQDKFEVVFNGLKLINTLLEKGEKGLVVEEYALTEIILGQQVQNFCNSYSTDKFTLRYIIDENKDLEQLEILANEELVTVLLNDVLSNAQNHAFKTNDIMNNKVDIYLSAENNYLELYIANNGVPFPVNFDKDKFIQKYQKAGVNPGAGIGGYDINRIVSYFNGEFQLLTDSVLDYNTLYQFKFPILNTKEDTYE